MVVVVKLLVIANGKEANSHLVSITCQVVLICLTLSLFKDDASPMWGPPQSPKMTKDTTKIIRPLLSWLFYG